MNTTTSFYNKRAAQVVLAQFLAFFFIALLPLAAVAQSYSGPIVITKGGTYTGNWESRDSNVSAVEIQTTEPVIIVNSNIRAAGRMIRSAGHGAANVTVKNTNGYGIAPTPSSDYKKPRNFVAIDEFKNIVVENCYIEGAAGIAIGGRYVGDGSQNQTLRIRYNKAKNIDGRIHGGTTMVNFVSLNFRGAVRYAEVAWNQVINEPGKSAVEDNINVSNTRGTSDSPIRIHNNYIQGAYPVNPLSSTYSGGGIIMDSWWNAGMPDPASIATAYVKVYDNQTVNLSNYNYAIAGGNNIEMTGNRAVNSAKLADGSTTNTHNIGFYAYDYYKKGVTHSNSIHRNTTGLMGTYAHQRNDEPYLPDGTTKFHDNATFPAGPITKDHEKKEYDLWLSKLSKNNITLGPGGSAPAATTEPAPAPAPAPEEKAAPTTSTPVATTSGSVSGKLTREFWADTKNNGDVKDIPVNTNPTNISGLSSFEAPSNVGSTYGQRISGYITAPETGLYTFWIAGDDNAELYLSTSESKADKKKIASLSGWTNAREWDKYDSQKSVKIKLEAGKRYYIEALHIQNWGNDNLAVAWALPNGAKEAPIAGNRFSTGSTSEPAASTNTSITATGRITRDFWADQHGGNISNMQLDKKPTSTTELTSFEAPTNAANNYSQRISGYITAPESGLYTFWIAGDDNAELYLSTTESPANKKKIASVSGYTSPREWTKYGSQKSAQIKLEAGKRYYIEALHKEDGGGDNLAVAWELPNGAKEAPIAGNRLSPIGSLEGISAMQISKTSEQSDAFFTKATAYPNPFRDVVTLTLGTTEAELAQVVVLDQTGREVYKEENPKLVNNEFSINLADLKGGLYILKYTDKAGKANSLKIVKE